jgi:hypothetical protein
MKRRFFAASLALILALGPVCLHAQMSLQERRRAVDFIDKLEKIEEEQTRPKARAGRTFEVSEADLNLFIAYRIFSQGEKYVKSCEIKLLAANRVEGRLVIDLSGTNFAFLLPSKANLLFSAGFETRDGKIRIAMDKLFLETQPLSPALIDTVIGVVSRMEGVPPTTLQDWYPLPYGIKRMDAKPGRVLLGY